MAKGVNTERSTHCTIAEQSCGWCGEPVLMAVTLRDGRTLRRHRSTRGEEGAVYCSTSCRSMASRSRTRRRAKSG